MDIIRFAIENPVKVSVGVLLVLLFGVLSLFAIPIQLTPNIDEPVINIATNWTGRSPEDIERELIEAQEDKLKGVTNLKKMTAVASTGQAQITLEFYVGTDISAARQEVADALREVSEYPDDVDEPVITTADVAAENPIAWMLLLADDPAVNMDQFKDLAEDRIKPFLERVPGIAEVRVYGGRERQVHIKIDPRRLAERDITFNQLRQALRLDNVDVSAGTVAEGRQDVRMRWIGKYDSLEQVEQTIVAYGAGGPIRIADLGSVEMTLEKRRSFVRSKGDRALALPAYRETGSNVMQVMADLKVRIEQVNKDLLPPISPPGVKLELRQVYDETVYIQDALDLVLNNLWIGGTLAVAVLLTLLHKLRPTGIVALAIPISVVGTFVALTAAGRNLNVISLAGLAFAVGMVVDSAIVVLENIDRHIHMGKSPAKAAYDATREVWGAILASTLTTLAVFVPVLSIQEEAGQLFRDISLAICAAVALSLLVSVTVIPSASARFLRPIREARPVARRRSRLAAGKDWIVGVGRAAGTGVTRAATGFADVIHWMTQPTPLGVGLRVGVVAFFTLAALIGAWVLMPPTTYLPRGNRNLVFGMMFAPPGYNIDQNEFIARRVESRLRPYWEAEDYAGTERQTRAHPVIDFETQQLVERIPPIENFFFVSFGPNLFMGAMSKEQFKENAAPLSHLLTNTLNEIPGTFGFAQQLGLFGRGIGGTNSIEVELKGTDLELVREAGAKMMQTLMAEYGRVQPDPGNFNLPAPELQIRADKVVAAELGVDGAAAGLAIQALVDGAIIGDFRERGESLDLLLARDERYPLTPELIAQVPVAWNTPDGNSGVVPLSAFTEIRWAEAPQVIKRIEELRAVTLTVVPPEDQPLEVVMAQIADLTAKMRATGDIPPGVEVDLAGTASKLIEVRRAMLGEWTDSLLTTLVNLVRSRLFLALVITFLLMAALFESYLYPFVILFTVPLATVGGFIGLAIMHYFVPTQLLDVLTMLGFVILIGVVVNNAILIVHQALNFMRGLGEGEGDATGKLPARQAIRESVRTRFRPVLMTTTTSVCGMLPLVLMPGAGSELYKGLGSVVIGGLIVSTLFTLIVVPLLFSLAIDARFWVLRRLGRQVEEDEAVAAVQPAK